MNSDIHYLHLATFRYILFPSRVVVIPLDNRIPGAYIITIKPNATTFLWSVTWLMDCYMERIPTLNRFRYPIEGILPGHHGLYSVKSTLEVRK